MGVRTRAEAAKQSRASWFEGVWDEYEKQTDVLILRDMPALGAMSTAEYEDSLRRCKHARRVGAFDVCHYVGLYFHGRAPIRTRPYPKETTDEEFRTLARKWDAVPAADFFIWDAHCDVEQEAPMYLRELSLEPTYFTNGSTFFVAFEDHLSDDSPPVGMAEVRLDFDVLKVEFLTSKQQGAGSALLKAIDAFARTHNISMSILLSTNWIKAPTRASCLKLPKGEYTSLNEFYKRHGYRDTKNACAPEWETVRIPTGTFEGPIKRKVSRMSKCYPTGRGGGASAHVDVFSVEDASMLLIMLDDESREGRNKHGTQSMVEGVIRRGISKYAYLCFKHAWSPGVITMCLGVITRIKDAGLKARMLTELKGPPGADEAFQRAVVSAIYEST